MRTSFALLSLLLVVLVAVSSSAQQDPEALYDRALEQYRAEAFEQSIGLFEAFRAAAPQNAKADDALWYAGRALARLDRPEQAAARFQQVRALGPEGNRFVEATTELARLRLRQGEPAAAVALLEPLAQRPESDIEDRRALRLLADARVELGRADWAAHRDRQAAESFEAAAAEYELLLRGAAGDLERMGLQEDLGRAHLRLLQTARDAGTYGAHRAAALRALDQALQLGPAEAKLSRLRRLRDEAAAPARVSLQGKLEGFGGADGASILSPSATSLWAPGAQAAAGLGLVIPVGWQQELTLSAEYAHDDFGLRTFNFSGAETDVGRILQRTEEFGAGLSWEAGSTRTLRSLLEASGGYRLAEDAELNSFGLQAKEKLDWRASPAWKLELDGAFGYSVYPAYVTSSGRELDHWLAGVKPQATWYLAPDFRLGLAYGFRFKQYLDAAYLSPRSKQYFRHTAELSLRASPGKVFRSALAYSLALNETRNYYVDLTGIGGPIVRDYYDYLEHALDLGLLFKWSPDFRTELDAKAALQDFLNYPARNAAGDALTGEKRRDLNLALDGEVAYRLWRKQANRFGDLWAAVRLAYGRNLSNSYYEEFFQTNYSTLAVTAGVVLELE